jgi:hypothetical protein
LITANFGYVLIYFLGFEKSESKTCWFQLYQKSRKTSSFCERTGKELAVNCIFGEL